MANKQLTQVQQNAITRMQQRVAEVQKQRMAKHASRIAARKHAAFIAQVHEFAEQQGLDPKVYLRSMGAAANARANSATVNPSTEVIYVNGEALRPCKAVHALCATIPNATRAEMLQLCKDNGINAGTASTQVGKYRAAAKAEQEATE